MQKMIIEIRGVDFINKGAELMLHAIVSKVKSKIPGALFVMESTNNASRRKHLEYGIYTKSNFKKLKIPFKYIFILIPLFLRRRWHYVNDSEVKVILDASGFAFGDTGGVKKALNRLGDHIAKWKKDGKKVILLPQAFGPFSTSELVKVMRDIVKCSDLIFARDQLSAEYLNQLNGSNKKLALAPDFTNLIDGIVPAYFNSSEYEVAIIVNSKMIETTTNQDGNAYVALICRMIIMIENLGYNPYFLIHESNKDRRLADAINREPKNRIPVIQDENPLHVKGIIAKSKAVFTSRFHGLVSCLSQGVPCLATGWSHKYEMLLKDYNYPEGMLDVHCNDEVLRAKIESVLKQGSRYLITEKLQYEIVKQKQLSEEMWKKVFTKIGCKETGNNNSPTPAAILPANFLVKKYE